MTQGIIVARDGYRVENATILQQVFNSGLNTLKVGITGSGSNTASGLRTVELTTAQNYIPSFLAWFEVENSGKWFLDGSLETLSGAGVTVQCLVSSENKLVAKIDSSSSVTVVVKYVLFIDPGV